MSAWPGGPCPDCGDDMPANLVRCATCRALLNPELKPADIMPYQPVRLQEVDSFVEADLVGYFVGCPRCRRKLRVHGKYDGQKVACRFCNATFLFALSRDDLTWLGAWCTCPHCDRELRTDLTAPDHRVTCRYCDGQLLVQRGRGRFDQSDSRPGAHLRADGGAGCHMWCRPGEAAFRCGAAAIFPHCPWCPCRPGAPLAGATGRGMVEAVAGAGCEPREMGVRRFDRQWC